MISKDSRSVIQRAKAIYDAQYRANLEQTDPERFASIEPDSGKYFLGDTFDEAANAALDAFPDRLTYTLRIGHRAALHMGVLEL